jgi:hypothetical protein
MGESNRIDDVVPDGSHGGSAWTFWEELTITFPVEDVAVRKQN